jgi:hypothetical protein
MSLMMMTNPYRAMCAELADVVYEYCILHEGRDHLQPLVDRARALLDQPVAEGPTDEELNALWIEQYGDTGHEPAMSIFGFKSAARAVLAKWGHQ